jgi:hypothetical protein
MILKCHFLSQFFQFKSKIFNRKQDFKFDIKKEKEIIILQSGGSI